jgi:hypothetical protein
VVIVIVQADTIGGRFQGDAQDLGHLERGFPVRLAAVLLVAAEGPDADAAPGNELLLRHTRHPTKLGLTLETSA